MSHERRPPLGIGLIGLGHHGSRYAKHLIHDLPEARLVAVCRRHAEEGSGLVSAPTVPCYADYHELIADPLVEAVVVVTPPSLNRDICVAVAEAKKALLVEKPLATTADEARMIAQAARGSGQIMMTAQTLRFDATIRMLRQRQAQIGLLQYLSLSSRMEPHGMSEESRGFGGRGCLLETGIHLLDLVRLVTGENVRTAACEMDVVPPDGAERRILGRLTTERGAVCLFDVSRVTSGRVGRIELIGAEGQLSADWCGQRVMQVSARHGTGDWPTKAEPTVLSALRAFVRSVRDGSPPPVSIEDGKRAVEIAETCYASARLGGQAVRVEYR
ncbi:MAG: Gfo/Idh/MocA family oxidoreductase [Nitrospira sp.]|uniref:Myo-inositol 2-dehydrogenase n=1 Tax=Nitrospira defluvii TaxID=330214 RepID=A0ABN7M1I5_9BACT|nr:Gfo/Idh/MocA family oxidoreductase [Nitrospira defluvii]MCS6328092.1 Gfo/Idh/MocA family oxidoreductase [Nitrospira sp.]CAE6780211.1 putative Myo-inositol 2-dehydrogenase [Nitrospira defluvii]